MDDGPVGEPVRLVGGDADWADVQDLANISLVGSGHELGDAGVETVQLLYVVRRVVHSLLGALEVGLLEGRHGDAERRREGVANPVATPLMRG